MLERFPEGVLHVELREDADALMERRTVQHGGTS
jgi:hypothetical protein